MADQIVDMLVKEEEEAAAAAAAVVSFGPEINLNEQGASDPNFRFVNQVNGILSFPLQIDLYFEIMKYFKIDIFL